MMSQSSASLFRWEKPCACTVESCQPACASVGIPGLPTLAPMHEPSHQILDPDFQACDI